MWWLIIPAAIGAAKLIYEFFDSQAQEARNNWHLAYEQQKRAIEAHRRNIEDNLQRAQASYDFRLLCDLHYSSVKVADVAFSLLQDARKSLDVMNTMLMEAKTKREEYKLKLNSTTDPAIRKPLFEEIRLLNELRQAVFPDMELVKEQKNSMLSELS